MLQNPTEPNQERMGNRGRQSGFSSLAVGRKPVAAQEPQGIVAEETFDVVAERFGRCNAAGGRGVYSDLVMLGRAACAGCSRSTGPQQKRKVSPEPARARDAFPWFSDKTYYASPLNLPTGGLVRLPAVRETELVGQTSMQVPHAKQSGIIRSRLNMAPITVDGQALAHDSQAMQVS